ncbi:hypothetical protein EV426DRAFT_96068 [Tirmania nivea]|nr:hypothetical protein EV426DRAFT_96068 [Tirmania nivea]
MERWPTLLSLYVVPVGYLFRLLLERGSRLVYSRLLIAPCQSLDFLSHHVSSLNKLQWILDIASFCLIAQAYCLISTRSFLPVHLACSPEIRVGSLDCLFCLIVSLSLMVVFHIPLLG